MVTRFKNIAMCLLAIITFSTINLHSCGTLQLINIVFPPFMILYYAINISNYVHSRYVFNLTESTIPLWTYSYKILFHALLFHNHAYKIILTTLTWFIFILWKQIRFIVIHAENRLAKIDAELYASEKGIRIAHLRHRVISEDQQNRFHSNLFKTNRLYMLPFTKDTEKDYCALHNYRVERIDGNSPTLNNDWERRMWDASKNNTTFLDNTNCVADRTYYTTFPIIYILVAIIATDTSYTPEAFVNSVLFLFQIINTFFLHNIVYDVAVDTLYYAITTIYMIMIINVHCP